MKPVRESAHLDWEGKHTEIAMSKKGIIDKAYIERVLKQAHEMGVTLMDEVVGQKATNWEVVNEAMCAIEEALRRVKGSKVSR